MKNKYFVFSSEISRSSGGIGNTTYYLIKSFVEYNCPTIGIVDRSPDLVSGATIYETKEKSILKRIIKGLIFYRHNNGNEGISLCLSWRYAIVPFLCGGKYIVMTHGNDVENVYRSSFRIRVENRLRNTILNHAAKICANSMYTASLVKQIRIKDEPIIIHPCSGEIVDYYEKASDGKYILSIGRLEERKGFQFVIEAFRKISNTKVFKEERFKSIIEWSNILKEAIKEDIADNYGELYDDETYGSVYLDEPNTPWRGKKLIDRIDY